MPTLSESNLRTYLFNLKYLFQTGTTNDGRFFLVTELLAGGSLFALLATETELPWNVRTRMWLLTILAPFCFMRTSSYGSLDLTERAKAFTTFDHHDGCVNRL